MQKRVPVPAPFDAPTPPRAAAEAIAGDVASGVLQAGRLTEAEAAGRQPLAAPAANDPVRGIVLMCCAVTCFAALDCTGKYLVGVAKLPALEVAWARFLGQLVAIVVVMGLVSVPRMLVTKKRGLQLGRSVLLMSSTVFNFLALRELRLDQTTTVHFLTPLVVALLSGPILGEWVGWRRALAIMVGFGGILIVVRPGAVPLQPAMVYALVSMASYALFMISTRYLSAYDPPMTTLFYSLFAGTTLLAPIALSGWVWPAGALEWTLMIIIGIFGAIGHYIFILANRVAPASTIAPFVYFQLLSMTSLGFFVFADVPDVWTLAGAAVIVTSGVYLIYRERVQKAAAATVSVTVTPDMRVR